MIETRRESRVNEQLPNVPDHGEPADVGSAACVPPLIPTSVDVFRAPITAEFAESEGTADATLDATEYPVASQRNVSGGRQLETVSPPLSLQRVPRTEPRTPQTIGTCQYFGYAPRRVSFNDDRLTSHLRQRSLAEFHASREVLAQRPRMRARAANESTTQVSQGQSHDAHSEEIEDVRWRFAVNFRVRRGSGFAVDGEARNSEL